MPDSSSLAVRAIPSSGEALPVLGLGTWQTFDIGGSEAERRPLAEVLQVFTDGGGSLLDSSPMYGRAEQVAGDLATRLSLRPRLFLATKVWTRGKEAGLRQMENSLRKLGADSIDLMQVHNLLDAEVHLETMAEWRKTGRIRYLGVTHYHASAHAEVARILSAHSLDFLQINYSAGERDAERELLPLARDRGMAVIANRPFAGGGILPRLRGRPLPPWAAELGCSTWPQLLLKFVLSHPAITCVIPATSKAAHMRENFEAARAPFPDAEMRERIAASLS